MPSSKRPGDETEGSARKKQLSNASRTGQACDRCKIRKIRCDARVGGCSPCLQNNTECKTTDRITGRATSRGHTEKIESENTSLRLYVVELQQQLREQGVEPKAAPAAPAEYATSQPYWPSAEQEQPGKHWDAADSVDGSSAPDRGNERKNSLGTTLPGFRSGLIGDNYLGVSSANSWLSPIEGTSLTLFGMKIDLADFIPQDDDPDRSATSYQTFLKHAFGQQNKMPRQPLPSYENCKVFAQWYFRSVQHCIPIIHKPHFMELLRRIHLENYEPNIPETVMVHMMLSLIMFQFASRNNNEQNRLDSMKHYHYSLSFVPDLIRGHQLADIQALAMICQLLRSQPRVGGAWMFINMVFGLAVELGLHRSANAWPDSLDNQDEYTREMRKRIFWSLLLMHTTIGGKLGRPMPLRLEDFDIEIPRALNDNLPDEAHLPNWRKCSFHSAIQMFRLVRIEMQVWSGVYSVNASSGPYEANLRHIEKEIQAFKTQLPIEYSGAPQTDDDRITALYLELVEHEIRLLMHHPSLYRSLSPQSISNSYDICLDSASAMLQTATQLKDLNSLDTTWYYAADFLAAIFTTLFVFSERKDQITSATLNQVRTDMNAWLAVMTEYGVLLGTGPRLAEAIRGVIEQSISSISRHLAARTASAAVASTTESKISSEKPIPRPQQESEVQQSQSQPYPDSNGYGNAYRANGSNGNLNGQAASYQMQPPPSQQQHTPHTYPPATHFTYPQAQDSNMPHYATAAAAAPAFENAYPAQEDIKPPLDGQMVAHAPQVMPSPHQHPNNATFLAAYHSPAPTQNGFAPQPLGAISQPLAWRNFTNSVMTNLGGAQDYLHSANALMGIPTQNKIHSSLDMQAVVASMNQGNLSTLQLGDGQQPWPIMHYDTDGGNVTGQ